MRSEKLWLGFALWMVLTFIVAALVSPGNGFFQDRVWGVVIAMPLFWSAVVLTTSGLIDSARR